MTDEAGRSDDQQAVGEAMMRLANAFRTLDPSGLEALYSEDADWTNAFGTTKKGRRRSLRTWRSCSRPALRGGQAVGPPQASMRSVSDNVAVVKTYIEREGQQTSDGEHCPSAATTR